ncbi:Surface antigen domain-containing protein [Cupriavidus sp. H18C1]
MPSIRASSRAHTPASRWPERLAKAKGRAKATAPAAATALAAASLFGCASPQTGAMQSIVDSWRGTPIDQARTQWGPPASVQPLANGNAYVWVDEFPRAQAPGSGPREARAPTDPAPATIGRCQRRLIAGADGIVRGGDWSGDTCCLTTAFGRCAALLNRKSKA